MDLCTELWALTLGVLPPAPQTLSSRSVTSQSVLYSRVRVGVSFQPSGSFQQLGA